MRQDVGNTLKYQDNREGLRALPQNAMECDKIQIPPDLVVKFQAIDIAEVIL
jgi:hypothetical protein